MKYMKDSDDVRVSWEAGLYVKTVIVRPNSWLKGVLLP